MFVEVHINRKIPTMKSLKERLKHPPKKASSAFIAPNATVIGTVKLGEQSSVWFGAVLRGDTDLIQVGDRSNIQDNAVLHADPGDPCIIGHDCVIGHSAIVHGATLDHHVLIGMGATVLNNAKIGAYSIVGANALVPSGMEVPPYSMVLGVPGKIVKTLGPEVEDRIHSNAQDYVKRAAEYKEFFEEN